MANGVRVSVVAFSLASDTKDLLEMDDWVRAILTAHLPAFGAAAPEESAEVVLVNQDSSIDRYRNHLLWRGGRIEIPGEFRITIHLSAEVI
jgi:hypothetical protein